MKTRTYQIKDVADVAKVSTRTLRHYDELGLLTPSVRSAAGYRLYTDADLLRLHQIMIGRSLGLALEDIRRTLDDSTLDRKTLLQQQREALVARAEATTKMIKSIDAAIALFDDEPLQEKRNVDMKKIFDGFDPAEYEVEVEQRWGGTEAYRESSRRTRDYTEADWRKIKEESGAILNDAIDLLRADVDPEDPRSTKMAERYRLWVDRWFYPCSRSMHTDLSGIYQGDSRYAQYFNDRSPGLANFISAAIRANSQSQEE